MIQVNNIYGSVNPAEVIAQSSATDTSNAFSSIMQTKVQAPQSLNDIFERASAKYGVPANLLKAVGKAESDFKTTAVSKSGAQGVMQLMPATARELGVTDSFDPEQNIMGGAKYLSSLLKQYDADAKLALAAYNAGSNNVDKYGGIPPFKETQNYVVKVMQYAGAPESLAVPTSPLNTGRSVTTRYSASDAAATAMPSFTNAVSTANPFAGTSSNINPALAKVLGYDSSTATSQEQLYYNIIQNILSFNSYSKDDYLLFLEQLKLSMSPNLNLNNDSYNDSFSQTDLLKTKMLGLF